MLSISLGYSSLAVNPRTLIEDAELIVTAEFKDFADTDFFVIFRADTIHKGNLAGKEFAVYFSDAMVDYLNDLEHGVKFLFILNSRRDADLNVRIMYDESGLSKMPLYVPAYPEASFAVFNLTHQPHYRSVDSEYNIWLSYALSSDASTRRQICEAARDHSNWRIREDALRIIAYDIHEEILSLPELQQRAERYAAILDTTTNVYVESYALKFFADYYYPNATPVVLRRFEQRPLSAPLIDRYLEVLCKHPDPTVGLALLKKVTDWEVWSYDSVPLYRRLSTRNMENIGELINITLSDERDSIYNALYEGILMSIENPVFTEKILPLMLQLFKSYVSPQRTEVLQDLYRRTDQETILDVLASGGEKSALPFFIDAIDDGSIDIHTVIKALSNYTESDVGNILIDMILDNADQSLRRSAISALTTVLSHSPNTPSQRTIAFLQKQIDSLTDWDTSKKSDVARMVNLIGASQIDTVVGLLIHEIKHANNISKKTALIRKLNSEKSNRAMKFLIETLHDESVEYKVREAAIYQLKWHRDSLVQSAIYKVAASSRECMELRRWAINILMHAQRNPLLAVVPLINLLRILSSWEQYVELNSWTGFMQYLHGKDMTASQIISLDDCLNDFFVDHVSKENIEQRFDFVRTLRTRTDWLLLSTFKAAMNDPDPYVREEAEYALEDMAQKTEVERFNQ